jgi:predicted nucleotidyltransferase
LLDFVDFYDILKLNITILSMSINIPKEDIALYCKDSKDIVMAFVFGSYARGYSCNESDVDIAVYLTNESKETEAEIQTYLERILKKEVDLVILNRCSSVLSWTILRKGIPIIIKDRAKYINFLLEVSSEAEDFIDFNIDAYRRKYALRKAG